MQWKCAMCFLDFFKAIISAFSRQNDINSTVLQRDINKYFLGELDRLISAEEIDALKMTKASILFEGFYRHLGSSELKELLVIVKMNRWKTHFGTPTIPFLLSYKNQIDKTKQLFDEFRGLKEAGLVVPWHVNNEIGFMVDQDNNVTVDPKSISRVAVPSTKEVAGIFTKTHNPFGGFTTAPCDPVSQRFIEQAVIAAKAGGKVLEIGAAFGAATLEALAKGATVFCNDIDPENLAVVWQRFLEASWEPTDSITGNNNKLVLIPGELPNELVKLP